MFIHSLVERLLSTLIPGEKNNYRLVSCADSSDDSYVSAEEDPMEAPVFEFPLQDTVASAGADVTLKCIIAGTPVPEGIMFYSLFS